MPAVRARVVGLAVAVDGKQAPSTCSGRANRANIAQKNPGVGPGFGPGGAGRALPTAKSTVLAPSQRRGRVRLLLSTPLCSGIRWYLRASMSRSLHSEWCRTSSSVSTLLMRKSRLSSGSRTHFMSWGHREQALGHGHGDRAGGQG